MTSLTTEELYKNHLIVVRAKNLADDNWTY